MAQSKIPVRPAAPDAPLPPPRNSPDEVATLTADEARARLMSEGKDLTPDHRKLLTERAASSDPPRVAADKPRMSPFSNTRAPDLDPVDAAALADDDLVMCLFPRATTLTIEGHRRVKFGIGQQPVPRRFVEPVMHSYLHARGVRAV